MRYYLPKRHVRIDLLISSDTVTQCPYKGQAEHWSIRAPDGVHDDLACLTGHRPLPESQKIAGPIRVPNEKVDIYVDRVLRERPTTKFS